MEKNDNKPLFGRYSREECGLPPVGAPFYQDRLNWRQVVFTFLAATLIASIAGFGAARYRESILAVYPSRVLSSPNTAQLVRQAKTLAATMPQNPAARNTLAHVATLAAERSPRRLGYYANAANLFAGTDAERLEPGLQRFAYELSLSGAQSELGNYPQAFSALSNAEEALRILPESVQGTYRLLLVNSQAYLLATAPAREGGNAKEALRLAELMISSRDPLPDGSFASDSAALMDTLATAYFKNGRTEEAGRAQTLALGLADSQGLDIYLRHYDEFTTPARKTRQNQRKNDVQ